MNDVIEKEERSKLEVSFVQNKSIVTSSKSVKPLKLINPETHNNVCHVVFSNYGGGFVDGDEIKLDILTKPKTKTVLSTQANTRVYKSKTGAYAKQIIKGKIEDDALLVMLNDPLVPQKHSNFEQQTEWNLGKGSTLFMMEWFLSGRIHNDESFVFNELNTKLKITQDGKPLIWDNFKIDPDEQIPTSPGSFGVYKSYINIYLAGHEELEEVTMIESQLNIIAKKYFHTENVIDINKVAIFGTTGRVNQNAYIMRCAAKDAAVLQPMVKETAEVFDDKILLGFNPLRRKF